MTVDECLTQLQVLAASQDPAALDQAGGLVEQFAGAAPGTPRATVEALGDLQGRFGRETPPSKMRSDILDLIGDRVAMLLESDQPDR